MVGFRKLLIFGLVGMAGSLTALAATFEWGVDPLASQPSIFTRAKSKYFTSVADWNVYLDRPSPRPADVPVVRNGSPAWSIVDSLVTYNKYLADGHPNATPGPDVYPAGVGGDGYDRADGFGFQVKQSCQLSGVQFMVEQFVAGGGMQALLYQGSSGAGYNNWWMPLSGVISPLATFNLTTPSSLQDNTWTLVSFTSTSPFTLTANTPYALVFDPIPDGNGAGSYALGALPQTIYSQYGGFASSLGTTAFWDGSSTPMPSADVLMPEFVIDRMLYWSTARQRWETTWGEAFDFEPNIPIGVILTPTPIPEPMECTAIMAGAALAFVALRRSRTAGA